MFTIDRKGKTRLTKPAMDFAHDAHGFAQLLQVHFPGKIAAKAKEVETSLHGLMLAMKEEYKPPKPRKAKDDLDKEPADDPGKGGKA